LPKSSVSDFERFALKVEEHIAARVKKSEEERSAHRLQKKERSLRETEKCMQQKRSDWKLELTARERQDRRAIADEAAQQWSAFKKESEVAVKEGLKIRLEKEFPSLVECFVKWASQEYEKGIFIMPAVYHALVNRERFELQASQKNTIIFRNNNLYIEYSVERIMEELKSEMTAMMHFEEDPWQA